MHVSDEFLNTSRTYKKCSTVNTHLVRTIQYHDDKSHLGRVAEENSQTDKETNRKHHPQGH